MALRKLLRKFWVKKKGVTALDKEILLIDDDFEYARLLAKKLTSHGYVVYNAYSGKDGIQKAKTLHKPDIILLDVIMHEMSGYEVCLKLREDKEVKGIPIIMLTATENAKEILEKLKVKADGYIMKPFEVKDLVDRIESVLKETSLG